MSFCCLQNCAANAECWKYINSANLLDFSANICIFRKDQDVMRKLGLCWVILSWLLRHVNSVLWSVPVTLVSEKGQRGKGVIVMQIVNTLVHGTVNLCLFSVLCQFIYSEYNNNKKSVVIKRGGRSCPIICEPGLYFQRIWKLAVRSKGDMLLKELMPPGVWISFFGNCFL